MTGVVRRKLNPDALFFGLLLIAAGVAFLTGNFGLSIRTWWPMFIVLLGIPKLLRLRTVWQGLWLIGAGAWLQLVQLHMFGWTYGNSWPMLLILVGAGIALRALFEVAGGRGDESAS